MAKLNTLFPHSGSDTTLGRISKAFKDIDSRIDEVAATSTIPGNATTSEPGLMSATDKAKLDGMTKMAYIEDPAGDTVTKAEFIALRNALMTAGYMAAKA